MTAFNPGLFLGGASMSASQEEVQAEQEWLLSTSPFPFLSSSVLATPSPADSHATARGAGVERGVGEPSGTPAPLSSRVLAPPQQLFKEDRDNHESLQRASIGDSSDAGKLANSTTASVLQDQLLVTRHELARAQVAADTSQRAARATASAAEQECDRLRGALEEEHAVTDALRSQLREEVTRRQQLEVSLRSAEDRAAELQLQLQEAQQQSSTLQQLSEQHHASEGLAIGPGTVVTDEMIRLHIQQTLQQSSAWGSAHVAFDAAARGVVRRVSEAIDLAEDEQLTESVRQLAMAGESLDRALADAAKQASAAQVLSVPDHRRGATASATRLQLQDSQDALARATASVSARREEVVALQQANAALEKEVAVLLEEVGEQEASARRHARTAESAQLEAVTQLQRLQTRLDQQESEANNLRSAAEAAQAARQTAERQHAEVVLELASQQTAAAQQAAALEAARLAAERDVVARSKDGEAAELLAGVQAEADSAALALASARAELVVLQDERVRIVAALEAAQSAGDASAKELTDLHARLRATNVELEAQKRSAVQLKAENELLQQQIEARARLDEVAAADLDRRDLLLATTSQQEAAALEAVAKAEQQQSLLQDELGQSVAVAEERAVKLQQQETRLAELETERLSLAATSAARGAMLEELRATLQARNDALHEAVRCQE